MRGIGKNSEQMQDDVEVLRMKERKRERKEMREELGAMTVFAVVQMICIRFSRANHVQLMGVLDKVQFNQFLDCH